MMPAVLQSMWQSRYLAVCVCDLQGQVLHVNDAGCGLLGRAEASLLGVSIYDHVENSSQLYKDHQQLLSYAKAEKNTAELAQIMSAHEVSRRGQSWLWHVDAEDVSEAEVALELITSRGTLTTEAEVTCHQTAAGEVFLIHLIPVPTDQHQQQHQQHPQQPRSLIRDVSRSVTRSSQPSQPTFQPTSEDAEAGTDYYMGLRRWLDTVPEIFDTLLPGAVAILDRDGVYHDARNAPDYVSNVAAEQCIGKTLEQVLAPELVPQRRRALEHVFSSKQPYRFIDTITRPEGVRYYDVCYSYIDEQFCLGVKYDITDRYQLEQRLAASEARANAMLAAIPDGVLTITREGVFSYVQPPKDFAFEHPVSAFMGKHLDEIPEAANMREVIRHYVHQTLETKTQHTHSYDVTMNGKTCYRDMRFSYLDADTCLVLVRDVSEWMDTALALQDVQVRFDQFMRVTDDIFAVLDLSEYTLLYINPSYQRLTGYNPRAVFSDLANMRFLDTIDPRDHERMYQLRSALKQGRDMTLEYRMVCRDGSTRWMLLRCRVVLGAQTAVCVATDISELKHSQDTLAASRDYLRNMYEALPDAIARLNPEGRYVSVKMPRYFASIASREEMLGSRIEDTLPAEVAALMREHFERTLEHGVMQVCRYDVPHQGGVVSREVRFVRLADGDVLGVYRDITQPRRTERELAHRERQLQAIFDTLPYGISRYDRSGMCLERKRPSHFHTFSPLENVDVIGKHLADIVPPDIREHVLAHFQALLTTNQAQIFDYQLERNGQTFYREATLLPLGDDEVLSVIRDISDQRRLEQTLIDREQQMRAIFSALPDVIAQFSRDGVYVGDIHGGQVDNLVLLEQMQGKTFLEMDALAADDARALQAALKETFTTQEEHNHEYDLEIDGKTYYRELRFVYLNEHICLGILRDITAWHEMDMALTNALEHSTVLLKEVHHRVRNNLQVLSSVLHLHAASLDDDLAKRVLTENRRRIQTLALVHRVLYDNESYAKIALDQYLSSGTGLFAADMRRQKIVLELDTESVYADLDHAIPFGLIVNELMSNVLRHAFVSDELVGGELEDALEPRVQVTLRQYERHITLEVIDNGIGLPDDFTEKQQHTLGMAVISSLTEQLSGTFEVAKREDTQGTRATLTFTC